MKTYILFAILAFAICDHIGQCGMAPIYRPLSCFKNVVLQEDFNELLEVQLKFRAEKNHKSFALYLGDMIDKKEYRELKKNGKPVNIDMIGKCGVHPKYLKFECYSPNVLRRDKMELKEAYDKLHDSNLEAFNKIYSSLQDKKFKYYN